MLSARSSLVRHGVSLLVGTTLWGANVLAPAATLYVAQRGRDFRNPCTDPAAPGRTLAHAVAEADSGDTIQVGYGSFRSVSLTLDKDLFIIGAGVESTVLEAAAAPALARGRVLTIQRGASVTLENVWIRNGRTRDARPGEDAGSGGVILNRGRLVLQDCRVSGGRTGIGGWGREAGNGGSGGGICNEGDIDILRCQIVANRTGGGGQGTRYSTATAWGTGGPGGGIANLGTLSMRDTYVLFNVTGAGGDGGELVGLVESGFGGGGGGIHNANPGSLTMWRCVVAANRCGSGGVFRSGGLPGGYGGGIDNHGQLVVEQSLLAYNLGGTGGTVTEGVGNGGGGGYGGALANHHVAHIENSTVHANLSGDGSFGPGFSVSGSGGSGGGIWNQGELTISHCTITENHTGRPGGYTAPGIIEGGGGIRNDGELTLHHTILAENGIQQGTEESGPDCLGEIHSQGHNLVGNTDGCVLLHDPGTSITGADPMLAGLNDYGGFAWSQALLPGSPAIDAGDPSFSGPPYEDQRGQPRISGEAIDIGAYETIIP